jgi:hypothetical protein
MNLAEEIWLPRSLGAQEPRRARPYFIADTARIT